MSRRRALVRSEVPRLRPATPGGGFDRLMGDPVHIHQVRAVPDGQDLDLVVGRPRRVGRERLLAPSITVSATTEMQRINVGRGNDSVTRHIPTTTVQAAGGVSRNDRTGNPAMPRMLPTMSRRYASRGSNVANDRVTPLAIMAMMTATARKTIGSVSHIGSRRASADEDQLGAGPIHLHRHGPNENDEERQGGSRPGEQLCGRSGPQEADADPEEAAEQHEVREVREIDDVRTRPPDQRELREQHQEAQTDQPRLAGHAGDAMA